MTKLTEVTMAVLEAMSTKRRRLVLMSLEAQRRGSVRDLDNAVAREFGEGSL